MNMKMCMVSYGRKEVFTKLQDDAIAESSGVTQIAFWDDNPTVHANSVDMVALAIMVGQWMNIELVDLIQAEDPLACRSWQASQRLWG